MKKNLWKAAAACGLCATLLAGGITANAAYTGGAGQTGGQPPFGQSEMQPAPGMAFGQQNGRMVISEPGNYTLTGNMRGMVYVDPGQGNVQLTLDGASLDGSNGPAIMAVSGDRLDIRLADGSMNSIYGGPNQDLGAAVYSEIPVFFDGGGRLDMVSDGQDAFRVNNGGITFNGGDVRIEANGNGFNAPNVNFNGGMVALDAQGNNFAPGASMNQNGGQFQQNWTPTGDFMQNQQSSQFGPQMNQQSGQPMGRMPGMDQMNGQQAPAFGNQNNQQNSQQPTMPNGNQQIGQMPGSNQQGSSQQFGPNGQNQGGSAQSTTTTAGTVVTGTTENSAMSLTADYGNVSARRL